MAKLNIALGICLQEDNIGRIASDRVKVERNLKLHGGYNAAIRILGPGGEAPVPVTRFVKAALEENTNFYTIFIDDQHENNMNDPFIKEHFEYFGIHCVKNTPGARPVGGLEIYRQHPHSQIVTTDALNLATHEEVVEAISSLIRDNNIDSPKDVAFLVFGGLTDILVADAIKGLSHIAGIPNPYDPTGDRWMFFGQVGVAKLYCFSNVLSDHEAALRSLAKVNVKVLNTDREIFDFMQLRG